MDPGEAFLDDLRLIGWWALDGWEPPAGASAQVIAIDKVFSGEGFDRFEHTFARVHLTDAAGLVSQHTVELVEPVDDGEGESLDSLRVRIESMGGLGLAEGAMPDGGYHHDAEGYAITHLDMQMAAGLFGHLDTEGWSDNVAAAAVMGYALGRGIREAELRTEYQDRAVRAERDAEARSTGARLTAAKRQKDKRLATRHALELAAERLTEPAPPGRRWSAVVLAEEVAFGWKLEGRRPAVSTLAAIPAHSSSPCLRSRTPRVSRPRKRWSS